MNLLEKALSAKNDRVRTVATATDEMIDLAMAYAKHEVSARQVAHALGVKNLTSATNKMHQTLKEAVRTGKLK